MRSIFFFQAEDGIRDGTVTGVQTCALPILYYRLNGITLELPALLDRADKERVIHHALAVETGNGRPAAIEMDALQRLLAYPWPGNIRELRNVIRTALAICEGGVVRGIDLPREIREADLNTAAGPLPPVMSGGLAG